MDRALYFDLIFRGLRDKYGQEQVIPMFNTLKCGILDGGEGSGNFGHAGRKGEVGGSAKSSSGSEESAESSNFSITEEEAQKMLSSKWEDYIKNALSTLPKSKNGRQYLEREDFSVDVPMAVAGESKKEIFLKSKSKEEKIGALFAVKNIQVLFRNAQKTEESEDKHKKDGVKKIIRFDTSFPLQIGSVIHTFNTRFTVREFEAGYKVLSPEILEVNKGLDLRLYAISTKK